MTRPRYDKSELSQGAAYSNRVSSELFLTRRCFLTVVRMSSGFSFPCIFRSVHTSRMLVGLESPLQAFARIELRGNRER